MILDELLAREAIRDTLARYNAAGDRLQVDDYCACFTVDGVIESHTASGEEVFRYAGRETIRAWQMRWRTRDPDAPAVHQASFVRHHLGTCRIELVGADTAHVRTYWVAWTDVGPDHAGYYLDDFRREGEAWLIARRRVRLDWTSPQSLFGTAVAHST